MKAYAGVGSRNTPQNILDIMTKTAIFLEKRGYTLRSGGAKGADTAFENGVKKLKEIYYANDATEQSLIIAERYHSHWHRLGSYAKKLHGRNSFQILGKTLNSPVEFVICWTPDGCERHIDRKITTGGTGTAISIASSSKIKVYNLYNNESIDKLRALLKTL